MNILVTGAHGFVGRNLVSQLHNIMTGKARFYGDVSVNAIFEYDVDTNPGELDTFCCECDFVFNLAEIGRAHV